MLTTDEQQPVVALKHPIWFSRVLRVEWLGQTAASLFWIVSVFVYGISETGDWLQLCAACAWFVANIAAIASGDAD